MELAGGAIAGMAGADGMDLPGARDRLPVKEMHPPAELEDGERHPAESLHSLTPARQRRLILDLLRAGHSDGEIGARFALSQWQIRNLRYRLGIKKDRGGRIRVREAVRQPAMDRDAPARPEMMAPAASAPPPPPSARPVGSRPQPARESRMGVRLGGRLPAEEAGRRLTALGGLIAASTGLFDLRIAVRQVVAGNSPAPSD